MLAGHVVVCFLFFWMSCKYHLYCEPAVSPSLSPVWRILARLDSFSLYWKVHGWSPEEHIGTQQLCLLTFRHGEPNFSLAISWEVGASVNNYSRLETGVISIIASTHTSTCAKYAGMRVCIHFRSVWVHIALHFLALTPGFSLKLWTHPSIYSTLVATLLIHEEVLIKHHHAYYC